MPDLKPRPDAPEGRVTPATMAECVRDAQPGDFVLSRTNAPLVKLTLAFIAAGRPAKMLGRDIGEQLVKLIQKARAGSVSELLAWVDAWADKQSARLMRKGKDPQPPLDQAECLAGIAEGESSVDGVRAKVRVLFDEDAGDADRITLASTHKAKGLERERVWLLRDTYLNRYPWSNWVEEQNLYYVAVTRAKNDLRLVA